MAVYKNRAIWEASNEVDLFVEIENAQVVLLQHNEERDNDIIVIPKYDIPKLIEYLQRSLLPKEETDVQ